MYLCYIIRLFFIQAPSREDHVNLHFVALVEKDGHLYELGKFIII